MHDLIVYNKIILLEGTIFWSCDALSKYESPNKASINSTTLPPFQSGMEPKLEVRGAVLLLVACDDSSFWVSCLIAVGAFFGRIGLPPAVMGWAASRDDGP